MSTQAIEKIRETEQNAELLEKAANGEARGIIEKAREEAELIMEKATAEGKEIFDKAVAGATTVAEGNSRETREEYMKNISELEAKADSKLSEAINIIKDQLIS